MRAGTGENTHARMVEIPPVFIRYGTGWQVVPFVQLLLLQQRSTQMFRLRSQIPLRHCVFALHAAPETRVAPEGLGTQAGARLQICCPPDT